MLNDIPSSSKFAQHDEVDEISLDKLSTICFWANMKNQKKSFSLMNSQQLIRVKFRGGRLLNILCKENELSTKKLSISLA